MAGQSWHTSCARDDTAPPPPPPPPPPPRRARGARSAGNVGMVHRRWPWRSTTFLLPTRHPTTRRPAAPCFIQRSQAINEEEVRLCLAIVAQAGNAASDIELDDAHRGILAAAAGVQASDFTIHPLYPENFIIICRLQAARDAVFTIGQVPVGNTSPVLRPWTRLAHAEQSALLYKITLELEGIPPHVWNMDTVSKLLAPKLLD
ncbi:hypothetical protein PVAP13_1NG149095 [Panicum virgatum]|uniref:Uncharacterized protein n=1 Tax=Panicum virgatum TaxID=38727 RepID=A0A8T0WXW9_PANVG|nr:hypothetical protein PVAP13_1NG149095 [Panicum virgatum]